MKKELAIEVKHISKSFKVYLDKGKTLKEKALFSRRRKFEERSVLNDVSFEVGKGEAIGLIGHNGCGKSTMLKLLTRIMYPDSGVIKMNGRVSSLIELGAGFHPDMSGRQNIYTNASIFGLTRKEIDERLDDIIAFSELEDFIDNPVRTYSSGMYMRLAFSVAINVDADILLIDEILAVGDANFQAKCFNRMREIKANGTTVVIVSHSLGQIEQICDRSIWIQDGRIRAEGIPREVNYQYLDFMGQKRQEIIEKEQVRVLEKGKKHASANQGVDGNEKTTQSAKTEATEKKTRWGNGEARISRIDILDEAGAAKVAFKTGDQMTFKLFVEVNKPIENVIIGIGIFRGDGVHCYGTNTKVDHLPSFDLTDDSVMEFKVSRLELLPGEYFIDIAIETESGVAIDYFTKAARIETYTNIPDIGVCRLEHQWKIGKNYERE